MFISDWEHWWSGKQLTGRGCSTTDVSNAEISTAVVAVAECASRDGLHWDDLC